MEPREEEGTIVGHGVLVRGDVEAKSGREGQRELVDSCVSLVGLIARRARWTGGAKFVAANVDIRCGRTAGAVRNLVEMVDCLCGGGNPNAAGEQYGSLCLRKCGQAIVGLASYVCGAAWVDDGGASRDDDGVVRKSGGESERGGGSLVGVRISTALLPCVLLGLASCGALATVLLLLLLLATLLLRWQPVPPLLLLPLLLLLLELGVLGVALDSANLVCVVAQLLLPRLVLLLGNECHPLNVGERGKGVFLLCLFLALYRGGCHLGGHTHIEYLGKNIHVPQ